jgi:hypothetical protein
LRSIYRMCGRSRSQVYGVISQSYLFISHHLLIFFTHHFCYYKGQDLRQMNFFGPCILHILRALVTSSRYWTTTSCPRIAQRRDPPAVLSSVPKLFNWWTHMTLEVAILLQKINHGPVSIYWDQMK